MNKEPWLYVGSIWKTEAEYWGWVRSCIRRMWANYPIAKNFKKAQMIPIPANLKPKFHPLTKSVGQCYACLEWFSAKNLQVDHLVNTNGCTSYETAHDFLDRMVMEPPSNFGLICKPCHKIKSHAEKYGMTFEEARIDKQAIALQKAKKDVAYLREAGIVPSKNKKGRKQQIIELLKEGK